MIGKFENEEALLKSYTDLEREFTKKCQELSKIKKELACGESASLEILEPEVQGEIKVEEESVNAENVINDGEIADISLDGLDELVAGSEEKREEIVEEESTREDCSKNNDIKEAESVESNEPIFGLDFRVKASEFLRNNEEAKEYAKEISKMLLKDKSLLSCSDPFGVAYALVLKEKGKQVEEKMVEPKNEIIKEQNAIEKATNKIPASIGVLGKSASGFSSHRVVQRFRTMEDARSELLRRFG